MDKLALKQYLAAALAVTVATSGVFAAAPTVGMAMATNSMRIDATRVSGNATLLSGNVVESLGGTSELRLDGGRVMMDTSAKVQVFADRAQLQAGKIQVEGGKVQAAAGTLRVLAAQGGEAVVERQGDALVVGSLRGAVKVLNQEGTLVASLEPGKALMFRSEFDDQDGAGTGSGSTKNPTNKKKAGAVGGWAALSIGAKTAAVVGIAAAVAVPTAVVTTRNTKSPVSK